MKKYYLIAVFIMLCCGSAVFAQEAPVKASNEVIHIARAYGLDSLEEVSAIRFTFNVQSGDRSSSREWEWNMKTGHIRFRGMNNKGTPIIFDYQQGQDLTKMNKEHQTIDRMFVNDQFWLLFPFHLVWDKQDITLSLLGVSVDPHTSNELNTVRIAYNPEGGGYTPGDVYDITYGSDYLIREWKYYRGGAEDPTLVTSWDKHTEAGPLTLSLEHKTGESGFKLWFSNVSVQTGSDNKWQQAHVRENGKTDTKINKSPS